MNFTQTFTEFYENDQASTTQTYALQEAEYQLEAYKETLSGQPQITAKQADRLTKLANRIDKLKAENIIFFNHLDELQRELIKMFQEELQGKEVTITVINDAGATKKLLVSLNDDNPETPYIVFTEIP